jgi:hypothetical protein
MTPDLTLECVASDGSTSVVVVDFKYRVEEQISSAVTSLHTYRDALVRTRDESSFGSDYERATVGALLLVPSRPSGAEEPSADWHGESAPEVLFNPEYQREFGLGAFVLRPGTSMGEIVTLLKGLLTSVRGGRAAPPSLASPL